MVKQSTAQRKRLKPIGSQYFLSGNTTQLFFSILEYFLSLRNNDHSSSEPGVRPSACERNQRALRLPHKSCPDRINSAQQGAKKALSPCFIGADRIVRATKTQEIEACVARAISPR